MVIYVEQERRRKDLRSASLWSSDRDLEFLRETAAPLPCGVRARGLWGAGLGPSTAGAVREPTEAESQEVRGQREVLLAGCGVAGLQLPKQRPPQGVHRGPFTLRILSGMRLITSTCPGRGDRSDGLDALGPGPRRNGSGGRLGRIRFRAMDAPHRYLVLGAGCPVCRKSESRLWVTFSCTTLIKRCLGTGSQRPLQLGLAHRIGIEGPRADRRPSGTAGAALGWSCAWKGSGGSNTEVRCVVSYGRLSERGARGLTKNPPTAKRFPSIRPPDRFGRRSHPVLDTLWFCGPLGWSGGGNSGEDDRGARRIIRTKTDRSGRGQIPRLLESHGHHL